MTSGELLEFLKRELDIRADAIASGIPGDLNQMALEYKYQIGIVHGLVMMRDYIKDTVAKELQDGDGFDD